MRTREGVIEQIKREIAEDIHAGYVPNSVKSFSELHDYVDANCYGGFCDERGYSIDFMNDCQNAVDKWLKETA